MSNLASKEFNPDYSNTYYDLRKSGIGEFNLKAKILNCRKCPLNSFTKPLSLTNINASLMIVGEYPKDILFETREGQVLSNALKSLSFDFDDIYFTSAIKCTESHDFSKCSSHLVSELILVNPLIVVSLGYQAGLQLVNSIKNPGETAVLPNNSDFLVTYSMSEVLENEIAFNIFMNHMSTVLNQLQYRKQQRSWSYV